jgi:DNA adenine methylase
MPADGLNRDLAPPLKWAGGKRWQVPHLRPLWAVHSARRLVEPFCGGLGVAISLQPRTAVLNDANPHLINFYRWIRRGLRIDLPLANDRALYEHHRRRFNHLLEQGGEGSREAASLFYFLNRTGFNGLCRFNTRGLFNVPFGQHRRITYTREFSALQPLFRRWTFSAVDFEELRLRPDDFVYADPPYDVDFTQYGRNRFRWADQVRTANWLVRHPGPVVLVNQATERVVSLYQKLGFDIRFLEAPRRISRTGDRRPAREVIATRNI